MVKIIQKKLLKMQKIDKLDTPTELIIKTKPEWIRTSLANKAQYQKNYKDQSKE